jgi:hypothetical protein
MQVNFAQTVSLIRTCGTANTFLLRGAPGVGKSSILAALAKDLPDYLPCYIDVSTVDLGDIAMPVIDRDAMVTNYAPNARFGLGRGQNRPVILMLDELTKAARPVLNMLLPVILERRLGDVPLPTGSIVFATGNLETDGVGDTLPGHAANRMSTLDYGNPTVDEWLGWAANNDVAPEVMAFARDFPQVFERYDLIDKAEKNPYIFSPLTGNTKAFCSPRSMEKASNLIKQRNSLGAALLPALIGTLGESAARDLEALVHLADGMTSFASIVADPDKARLPDGAGAYFLMAFSLAARAKEDTLGAIITYVNRFDSFEAKCLFATTLASNKAKVGMACSNRTFTVMASALGKFF